MQSYYDILTFAEAGTSPVLALPEGMTLITAVVAPGEAATARLEYTINSPRRLRDDPASCVWVAWTPGNVAVETAQTLLSTVSGIRLVTTGAAGAQLIIAGRR
jgi:hypothetical protein